MHSMPSCNVVRGQDKRGGLYWRSYVLWHQRQLASRNFFDSTYGGQKPARVAAQAWFEAVSNLIREVFAVTPAYDDEGQMATFSSGVAAINTGFDAERPRWAYLSVYVISWNKEDPDARQIRFLVSDRGQTLRRREGAVNVGGQAGRSWPDALERLRTKIHEVIVEFFGRGPADAFLARYRTQLSPRRFDPEAGLKVRELVDKLKR